jgi:hypothetical protein
MQAGDGRVPNRSQVVPIIGPSKAGMTPAVHYLWVHDLVQDICTKDLDRILGPKRRNGAAAAELMNRFVGDPAYGRLLVDVGSAQLVGQEFVACLKALPGYPASVAVLWCDEATFRRRNSSRIKPSLYYGDGPVSELWDAAREAGRLLDTSGEEAPDRWGMALARIVNEILAGQEAAEQGDEADEAW